MYILLSFFKSHTDDTYLLIGIQISVDFEIEAKVQWDMDCGRQKLWLVVDTGPPMPYKWMAKQFKTQQQYHRLWQREFKHN